MSQGQQSSPSASPQRDRYPNFLAASPQISGDDLRDSFRMQQKYVNHFFDTVDFAEVESFCRQLIECEGMVFFAGTGKSGIVARVISQMFQSIGLRGIFMNPTDALHGDVGMMRENDILVLFSKSGQTQELIGLVPAARAKRAKLIAIVSNRASQLVRLTDSCVLLPLEQELCPFDLAPTTSTILQLILGNTVLATIMKRINFTRDDYALNHPAGRIGKRLTVKVDSVMVPRSELSVCSPSTPLLEAIPLMSSSRRGCILVEDERGRLAGIFTDGDLRRAIERHGASTLTHQLHEFISSTPRTTTADCMAFEAMTIMETPEGAKKRVKELPVVDEERHIIGLLTLHDLVEYGL